MNKAQAVHEALLATQTVTDLYTGNCKGCGECCSRFLPLTICDKLRIRQFLATHEITLEPEAPDILDMRCPFYNGDRTCAIYDIRPVICKAYRCDKHANGTLVFDLSEMRGYETCDMRELVESCKEGN